MPPSHRHRIADIFTLSARLAEIQAELDALGGGATDLSYTAPTRLLQSSTGADVILPLVSSGNAGLAPSSGGGSTNFLRADGVWTAPGGMAGNVGSITVSATEPANPTSPPPYDIWIDIS